MEHRVAVYNGTFINDGSSLNDNSEHTYGNNGGYTVVQIYQQKVKCHLRILAEDDDCGNNVSKIK